MFGDWQLTVLAVQTTAKDLLSGHLAAYWRDAADATDMTSLVAEDAGYSLTACSR